MQTRVRSQSTPTTAKAKVSGFGLILVELLAALVVGAVVAVGAYQIVSQGVWAANGANPAAVSGSLVEVDTGAATLELVAVGDVMLSRKVDRYLKENGPGYVFALVDPILREADLSFANLESPIGTSGKPLPGKGIWFRARPESVQALTGAGLDVVSVANNHALDYDTPAFLETLALLRQAGIGYVGGGADIKEARQPLVVEKKGLKIAFLAYSEMAEIFWSRSYPRMLRATSTEAGIAPLRLDDVLADVAGVRGEADLVVVSLHWGQEYMDHPTPAQREIAHRLVDAGVDLILGHHPHVLQGFEVYRGALIAYSLGNFVFDQAQRQTTQEGLLLRVRMDRLGLRSAQVLPVYLPEARPRVATGELGSRILNKTRQLTVALDSEMLIRDADGYGEISGRLTSPEHVH